MSSDYDNLSELNQPLRLKRPVFERLQDLIFRFDLGMGVRWFRLGLFLLVVFLVILIYTGTQFYGLRDREVMDLGQLGRNLALGRGYVTRNIRPLDLAYLAAHGKPTLQAGQETIPELWTPPVYPLILSGWFHLLHPQTRIERVKQQMGIPLRQLPVDLPTLAALYESARIETLRLDRSLVLLAWLFFIVDLGVVFWLATELFDRRVALLCLVLCLLCDPLLDACIAGSMLPWLALLVLLVLGILVKAQQWAEHKESVYWVTGALIVCGLVLGVAILTSYSMVCLLVPVTVMLKMTMRSVSQRIKFGACLGVCLLVVFPWMVRNSEIADSPFGLARWAVTRIAPNERGEEVARIELERRYDVTTELRWQAIAKRALINWDKLYRETLKDAGANFLMAFFLVALLHRFRRDEALRLQWFVLGVMIVALLWLGIAGPPKKNFFTIFVPVIAMYAAAFFFVLFERWQFRKRWIRRGVVGLFVGVNILPVFMTLLPPAPPSPYPPYDGGVIASMGETFREGDLLASDIPWAVAWYADRSTVLIPVEEKTYRDLLNDNLHVISGIYLTTVRDWRWIDAITSYSFWLSKYDFIHPPPPGFPLQYRRQLRGEGGDQVLWSDQSR